MGPGAIASFVAIPPTLFFFFYPLGYAVGKFLVNPAPIAFDFVERFGTITMTNFKSEMVNLWTMAAGSFVAFLVGMVVVALITGILIAGGVYIGMQKRLRRQKSEWKALDRLRQ